MGCGVSEDMMETLLLQLSLNWPPSHMTSSINTIPVRRDSTVHSVPSAWPLESDNCVVSELRLHLLATMKKCGGLEAILPYPSSQARNGSGLRYFPTSQTNREEMIFMS